MMHIDVSSVLRGRVSGLYTNLVTRPTGAAVRNAIEEILANANPALITAIDFTHVQLLDFSCADEIVAKLIVSHVAESGEPDRFMYFRGMHDHHLDAVEAVLERRSLAMVRERGDGRPELLGEVSEDQRLHWNAVAVSGPVLPHVVAEVLGTVPEHSVLQLKSLWQRRLIMLHEDGYTVPGSASTRLA